MPKNEEDKKITHMQIPFLFLLIGVSFIKMGFAGVISFFLLLTFWAYLCEDLFLSLGPSGRLPAAVEQPVERKVRSSRLESQLSALLFSRPSGRR